MAGRSALLTACFCLVGTTAIAQDDTTVVAEKNSAFCGYTFFTNSDDTLDFEGGSGRSCFDMKGGDDILILNRNKFRSGVEVSTGTGRDTIWTADGPDKVVDPDSHDKEIRTYGGDDVIDMRIAVEKDPFRGIAITPRTTIHPGSGSNKIMLGRDIYSNAFARQGFNIEMHIGDDARDEIGGVCGRPVDRTTFDIRTAQVPETSQVTINTFGCGIGVFGVFGDVVARQVGGRFALQTSSDGFRLARGENVPRIEGEVRAGSSLMLNLDKSAPASNLFWEGFGGATIQSEVSDPAHGGSFTIRAGESVYYEGDVTASAMALDIASQSTVDLVLDGVAPSSPQRIRLAGARMDIAWTYMGGSAFPRIRNDKPVEWEATRYVQPVIDYKTSVETANEEGLVADPDQVVNPALPSGIESNEPELEAVSVTPGGTRLTLVLRRENDRYENCASVRVLDLDGDTPDIEERCIDLAAAVRSLGIKDASVYERIVIRSARMSLDIDINGESGFNVDRLEVRY